MKRHAVSNPTVFGRAHFAVLSILVVTVAPVTTLAAEATEPRDRTYVGASERVRFGFDVADPHAWRIVRRFTHSPSPKSQAAARILIESAAAGNAVHSTGALCAMLEEIAAAGAYEFRDSVVRLIDARGGNTPFPDSVVHAAVRTLIALGGHNVEVLRRLAKRSSEDVRSTVAAVLPETDEDGDGATLLLISLAQSDESKVRSRALASLSKGCDALARPIVTANLTAASDEVRAAAFWWMARCGCENDVARLVSALKDESAMVRADALRGLLRMRSRTGCAALDAPGLDETGFAREYKTWCEAVEPR